MYTDGMPRRTKEQALATRQALLDAAERVFHAKGVSSTSLADIAAQAGTTRGAIYWHFRDKADLFNAMIDRVRLPLEDAFRSVLETEAGRDPMPALRAALEQVLDRAVNDARTRCVFEVATHKVEYIDVLDSVRQRHLSVREDFVASLRRPLRQAARCRGRRLAGAADVARGLHALIDGLIHNWTLQAGAFDLKRVGRRSIDAYLRGVGLGPHQEASP
jgi:TetR/AcrR family transcriptional regulator, acrAB operon repressor